MHAECDEVHWNVFPAAPPLHAWRIAAGQPPPPDPIHQRPCPYIGTAELALPPASLAYIHASTPSPASSRSGCTHLSAASQQQSRSPPCTAALSPHPPLHTPASDQVIAELFGHLFSLLCPSQLLDPCHVQALRVGLQRVHLVRIHFSSRAFMRIMVHLIIASHNACIMHVSAYECGSSATVCEFNRSSECNAFWNAPEYIYL